MASWNITILIGNIYIFNLTKKGARVSPFQKTTKRTNVRLFFTQFDQKRGMIVFSSINCSASCKDLHCFAGFFPFVFFFKPVQRRLKGQSFGAETEGVPQRILLGVKFTHV